MADRFGGFSRLQFSSLAILLAALLTGLAFKTWRESQPLPKVDPALEKRFIAISDSLSAVHLAEVSKESATASNPADITVAVNTATPQELQMLPGIGPILAARIVQNREEYGEFKTKADLQRIHGIGKKTLEKLSALIIID